MFMDIARITIGLLTTTIGLQKLAHLQLGGSLMKKKAPGCLGCIGDYDLYGDYNKAL